MPIIIERVDTYFENVPVTGIMCSCGSHNPFLIKESPCRCGDTMYPVLPGVTEPQLIKGHVKVRCDCRRIVICSGMTTTCDCGCDYNWNGDLLTNRSEWGLETGEHWTECY